MSILSLMARLVRATKWQAKQQGLSFSSFLLYLDFPYVHSLRSSVCSSVEENLVLSRNGTALLLHTPSYLLNPLWTFSCFAKFNVTMILIPYCHEF